MNRCESCGFWEHIDADHPIGWCDGPVGICERLGAGVAYLCPPPNERHPSVYLFPNGGPVDIVHTPATFGCALWEARDEQM